MSETGEKLSVEDVHDAVQEFLQHPKVRPLIVAEAWSLLRTLDNSLLEWFPICTYIGDREHGASYVYLVRLLGQPFYKIGQSRDPEKRRAGLSSGAGPGQDFELVHYFEADDSDAAEKWLHSHFDDCRVEYEFFRLDDKDVVFVQAIDRYEDGSFIREASSD